MFQSILIATISNAFCICFQDDGRQNDVTEESYVSGIISLSTVYSNYNNIIFLKGLEEFIEAGIYQRCWTAESKKWVSTNKNLCLIILITCSLWDQWSEHRRLVEGGEVAIRVWLMSYLITPQRMLICLLHWKLETLR